MLILEAEGKRVIESIEEKLAIKFQIICPPSVIRELDKMSRSKGEISRKAKLALKIVEGKCIEGEEFTGQADRDVIFNALELKDKGNLVIVATSDRELRKKIRETGIPTAYYREKQDRVELDYLPLV